MPANLSLTPPLSSLADNWREPSAACQLLTRQTFVRSRAEGCDRHSGQGAEVSFDGVNFIVKKTARQGFPGCRGSALLTLMSDAMLRVSKLAGVQAAFLEGRNSRFTVSASETDQEGRNGYTSQAPHRVAASGFADINSVP